MPKGAKSNAKFRAAWRYAKSIGQAGIDAAREKRAQGGDAHHAQLAGALAMSEAIIAAREKGQDPFHKLPKKDMIDWLAAHQWCTRDEFAIATGWSRGWPSSKAGKLALAGIRGLRDQGLKLAAGIDGEPQKVPASGRSRRQAEAAKNKKARERSEQGAPLKWRLKN